MQNTRQLFDAPSRRLQSVGSKAISSSFHSKNSHLPQEPRYKMRTEQFEDSLLGFQQEVEGLMKKRLKQTTQKQKKFKISKKVNPRQLSRRVTTDAFEEEKESLKSEIKELRNLLESKNNIQSVEDKLQKVLREVELKKVQAQTSNSIPPQSPFPSPFYHYPPYPPYPYQYPPYRKKNRPIYEEEDDSEYLQTRRKSLRPLKSTFKSSVFSPRREFGKDQRRRMLRKIFFVVSFVSFVKGETKKLSKIRRNQMKKYWQEFFPNQVTSLKNWFLNAHKYSFSIILEKSNRSFNYFSPSHSKIVRQQKEKLVMQLVHLSIKKLQEECTSQKVSGFVEILCRMCRRGSYSVNRFWTVQEMKNICISPQYGFFRVDESLEKFLITVLVFIKVLIFNFIVQPYKFDEENFSKKKEVLQDNMKIIGSIYYSMLKELVDQFLQSERNENVYDRGNWLKVSKEHIIECTQPLIIGEGYPEEGQYISGLYKQEQLQLKRLPLWQEDKGRLKKIIQKLHQQMKIKAAMMRSNLKYKTYH